MAGASRVVPVGAGSWTTLLSTEDVAFGGGGKDSGLEKGPGGEAMARLAPYAVELFGEHP
jgi:hypothetical protein